MRASAKKILFPFFLIFLCSCGEPADQKTVAELQDQAITVRELKNALLRERESQNPELTKNKSQFKHFKQKVLEDLLKNAILEKEALAQNISVSEAEWQKEEERYRHPYSEKEFDKMLRSRGIEYEDWRKLKRQNLLLSKFSNHLSHQIQVTPEQIKNYYESHPEEFTEPKAVQARHLLTDSEEKAKELLGRIRKGENFAKLAKEYSQSPERQNGGELPWFSKGNFPSEFDVCFELKDGQVSEIVPSLYGFHLFKRIAERAERKQPLSEVAAKIENWLKKEALEEKLQTYYQEVKSKYPIKVHSWTLSRIKSF